MDDRYGIREYPAGWQGRRTYVHAVEHGIVAAIHTYVGYDGRRYVYWDDRGHARQSALPCPHVIRDIGEYQSPIDNSIITSRSAHRQHLKIHDVIEVGNERMPAPRPNIPITGVGEAIKRHIEEVKALPENVYREKATVQAAEHAAISSIITAGT